ncbi:sensor histidine kinase [Mobilicoccus caccae]|uniref:histidine kinase n=1 Tax=Mobilicoccus caccae TaxID=1859295 RepID=A0ABQ6IPX5_9MICO|nr:histidine kinase [Mobilicoccus caccae]GMA39939.1 two-component sensor histidine kinase [Mobilicoccus caccae]
MALTISVAMVFSGSASGAWCFAAISLAKERRIWPSVLVLLVASAASSVGSEWWLPSPSSPEDPPLWLLFLLVVLMSSLVMAVGFNLGIRRDLVRSLQERAETAEREQASRAASARVAERSRIAREMHDVLAHRISTVAMHSGALAYRTDLSPQDVQGTARLIQENAHSALIELRDILGVLRDDARIPTGQHAPEPPQPTIADIADLVTDARATGQEVDLDLSVDPEDIPAGVGRHLYRSAQECLTNARKHAPGAPVAIRITRDGENGRARLALEVSNPLTRPIGPSDTSPTARPEPTSWDRAVDGTVGESVLRAPTSGLGLLGLAERADLAGGRLDHGPVGDRYVTRITVPWPERSSA